MNGRGAACGVRLARVHARGVRMRCAVLARVSISAAAGTHLLDLGGSTASAAGALGTSTATGPAASCSSLRPRLCMWEAKEKDRLRGACEGQGGAGERRAWGWGMGQATGAMAHAGGWARIGGAGAAGGRRGEPHLHVEAVGALAHGPARIVARHELLRCGSAARMQGWARWAQQGGEAGTTCCSMACPPCSSSTHPCRLVLVAPAAARPCPQKARAAAVVASGNAAAPAGRGSEAGRVCVLLAACARHAAVPTASCVLREAAGTGCTHASRASPPKSCCCSALSALHAVPTTPLPLLQHHASTTPQRTWQALCHQAQKAARPLHAHRAATPGTLHLAHHDWCCTRATTQLGALRTNTHANTWACRTAYEPPAHT